MEKFVIIEFKGEYDKGFSSALKVRLEGESTFSKITGHLPPATALFEKYKSWQSSYRRQEYSFRLKSRLCNSFKCQEDSKNQSLVEIDNYIQRQREECRKEAEDLREKLNEWLEVVEFRPIVQKLKEKLKPDEKIRILIHSTSNHIRRLPWSQWNFLKEYPNAEIALTAREGQKPLLSRTPSGEVKILCIIGNSKGINVKQYREELLKNLPNAKITFLEEPQREQLNDSLWQQPWDILFFAGHSRTEGQRGRIDLHLDVNQTNSLRIDEIKLAIKKAIEGGLQLAIFNCCDGLGLACELEKLNIPQLLVMREPLPDLVAQKFLNHFLIRFAQGATLYEAVRIAREKLQVLEQEFTCASWLPVIYQNPAVLPFTWDSLLSKELLEKTSPVEGKEEILSSTTAGNSSQVEGKEKILLSTTASTSSSPIKAKQNSLLDITADNSLQIEGEVTEDISSKLEEASEKEFTALTENSFSKLEIVTTIDQGLPSLTDDNDSSRVELEEELQKELLLTLIKDKPEFENKLTQDKSTTNDPSLSSEDYFLEFEPPKAIELYKSQKKSRRISLGITTSVVAVGLLAFLTQFKPNIFTSQSSKEPSEISTATPQVKEVSTVSVDSSQPKAISTFESLKNLPSGTFNYGGSTAWATIRAEVDPVIQSILPEFKLRYVQHSTRLPGSSTGIWMLLNEQKTFAQSSRPLRPSEYEEAKKQGFTVDQIPVAIDGIAIAVNPSLNVPGLTLEQLKDIYLGKITNWKEVGGPNLKILPYSRPPGEDGTVEFFVEEILDREKFGKQVQFISTTTEALRNVTTNRGGIYFASATKVVEQCKIKPLPIGVSSSKLVPPYIEPLILPEQCPASRNQLNRKAFHEGSYPLTRNLYVIIKQNGQIEEQAGKAYTDLLLSNQGQELIEKAGFVSIRK